MSRDDHQMKIRLPQSLKAEIEAHAKDARRTMNSEIVDRLEASFIPGMVSPAIAVTIASKDARIAELEFQVAELTNACSKVADRAIKLLRDMDKHQDLPQDLREAGEELERAAIGEWGLGGVGEAPYTDIQLYERWRNAQEVRAKWRAMMAAEKAQQALLRPGPQIDPLE
ncbi:Arc family DNA-binding protein [Aquincola sp. J276]|uniref:Arc family DNA-binding protein n=1 Tax=Aquincola sp. J276 TaxID=2898432 RepID=UPI002151C9ED|nr:Arc family DNA-binding protein [Aquincola sp. J276]MCR5865233.1 Arc family DNA-binding protein [Aquincola sp. J276]